MSSLGIRAGSSGAQANRPNTGDRNLNVGSPSNPLAVISQQETLKQGETNCPICVESLDASFRLPGEKAHIVPECGHTIHEACFVAVYGRVPVSLVARRKDLGVCGVCRAPMRLADEQDTPTGAVRSGGNDKFAALMGLSTNADKKVDEPDRRGGISPLALRRPPLTTSLSTMSLVSSNHQSENGEADDRVGPYPSNAIQSPGPTSVIIPAIAVQPEFTTITRRNGKSAKQAISCLITIQVPQAGKRDTYPAAAWLPEASRSPPPEVSDIRTPQRPHPFDAPLPSDRFAASTAADPFSHILADLKDRMTDFKSSGINKLGKIWLFDILKVRKGSIVLDISVYLFQHALVCVTEEKKKSIRGFLASPSYASLRNQATDDKGHKRDKGVLKLKGRIYFKHVKRVIDTSISGELSLTISMEDENVDSFILAFRDKNSLELWRKTIDKAVREAKRQVAQSKIAISPPISASPSTAGKLAEMGFGDSVIAGGQKSPIGTTQDRFENTDVSGRTPTTENGETSDSTFTVSTGTIPLLPIHTPLDLLIVCSVPAASPTNPAATMKIRLIKAAMEHACSMLGPYDRLSIVTYESGIGGSVRRTPFLSPGRAQGRNSLQRYLATLGGNLGKDVQGGSDNDDFSVPMDAETKIDMVAGVNYGLDRILQRTTKNPLTSMILIHDNGEAVKRAAMDLILARAETAKIPIHTIGYGKHQDSSGLWLLSSHTHGTYTFIREWYHLQDCLASILGGLASIAVTNYKIRLSAQDTDFRCRKVSGAPHAVLAGDGKHVDIDLYELQFGQRLELLVEMELEGTDFDRTDSSHGHEHKAPIQEEEPLPKEDSANNEMQIPKESGYTGEIYRSGSSSIRTTENLEQISNDGLADDVPLFGVDCAYQDPATNRTVARLSHPILLTVALEPRNSAAPHIASLANLAVARRRYELVASESITRALLLVSRQNWSQAQRVLQETSNILETVITNTVDVITKQTGTRAAARRASQASVLLDSLRAILWDMDYLIEGMEDAKDTFERDHRNFGAQQALVLRTQRAWTSRTHTEGIYHSECSREALQAQ